MNQEASSTASAIEAYLIGLVAIRTVVVLMKKHRQQQQ